MSLINYSVSSVRFDRNDKGETTKATFYEEYSGGFRVNPRDEILRLLAESYHRQCEDYDRAVCTGPIIKGNIQPASPEEWRKMMLNSIKVKRSIAELADKNGFSRTELLREISRQSK